jgi:hypothetical protein
VGVILGVKFQPLFAPEAYGSIQETNALIATAGSLIAVALLLLLAGVLVHFLAGGAPAVDDPGV